MWKYVGELRVGDVWTERTGARAARVKEQGTPTGQTQKSSRSFLILLGRLDAIEGNLLFRTCSKRLRQTVE